MFVEQSSIFPHDLLFISILSISTEHLICRGQQTGCIFCQMFSWCHPFFYRWYLPTAKANEKKQESRKRGREGLGISTRAQSAWLPYSFLCAVNHRQIIRHIIRFASKICLWSGPRISHGLNSQRRVFPWLCLCTINGKKHRQSSPISPTNESDLLTAVTLQYPEILQEFMIKSNRCNCDEWPRICPLTLPCEQPHSSSIGIVTNFSIFLSQWITPISDLSSFRISPITSENKPL